MVNKNIFKSAPAGGSAPAANAVNEAGGRAYQRSDKGILAQYASVGCIGSTYYISAQDQLKTTLELAAKVDPDFLAKTAIYAREQGHMKDMPALLTAILFSRIKTASTPAEKEQARLAFTASFGRCIDNGKMLKNFVQIVRSGVVGRKALASSVVKKMIQAWFDGHTDEQLVHNSIGSEPSLVDVIRLARVNPRTPARRALFKWLAGVKPGEKDRMGFGYEPNDLPQLIKDYEAWKEAPASKRGKAPKVPFQMLTSIDLGEKGWEQILRDATWSQTRQSLNSFLRNGAFKKEELVDLVAQRLQNKEQVQRSKVFPYQLMSAYNAISANAEMPMKVKVAVQGALDASLINIPEIQGKIVVCPDLSGSMDAAVTGNRDNEQTGSAAAARTGRPQGATSTVRCRDVAALVSAALLRKNPSTTTVLPFSDHVDIVSLNPLDSLATNTQKLAALPKGGTNCSLPLAKLNQEGTKADVVIYLSDNESWINTAGQTTNTVGWGGQTQPSTGLMAQWTEFKRRNPKAKLVCVDLAPNPTAQVIEREDIMSIGGWSDTCFSIIADFVKNGNSGEIWVDRIEAVPLYEGVRPASTPAQPADEEIQP